jgi:hypothetical protein
VLPTDLVGTDGPHRKAGMEARTDQSATEAFADLAQAQAGPLQGHAHALTANPHDAWDLVGG